VTVKLAWNRVYSFAISIGGAQEIPDERSARVVSVTKTATYEIVLTAQGKEIAQWRSGQSHGASSYCIHRARRA